MRRAYEARRAAALLLAITFALAGAAAPTFAGRAAAQEAPPPAPIVGTDESERVPGLVSEGGAFWLSAAGTVLPIAAGILIAGADDYDRTSEITSILVLGGILVGPGTGHFYAHRPGRAFTGIGIRTLALAGMAIGIGTAWESESSFGATFAVLSIGAGVLSGVADIVEAPSSARMHNEEVLKARVGVSPTIGGDGSCGVRLAVTF